MATVGYGSRCATSPSPHPEPRKNAWGVMSGRVLGFRLVVAVGFVVAVGLCFFFVCLDWIWFANDFFGWFAGLSRGAAIRWFFDDRFFGCFATDPRDGREEKG